jgi:hypothetical protein
VCVRERGRERERQRQRQRQREEIGKEILTGKQRNITRAKEANAFGNRLRDCLKGDIRKNNETFIMGLRDEKRQRCHLNDRNGNCGVKGKLSCS